jgi:hypothetical protein
MNREGLEFLAPTMCAPAIIYLLVFHTWAVETSAQEMTPGALALAGGWAWVVRNA